MSELRQAGQFVPTLMLTARGRPEDVLRGFAAGADDYLAKPFELAILIARIQGLVRRRDWLRASLDAAPRPLAETLHVRRKIGALRPARAARARAGLPADR